MSYGPCPQPGLQAGAFLTLRQNTGNKRGNSPSLPLPTGSSHDGSSQHQSRCSGILGQPCLYPLWETLFMTEPFYIHPSQLLQGQGMHMEQELGSNCTEEKTYS